MARSQWILLATLPALLVWAQGLAAQSKPDQAADMMLASARRAYNEKNYPFAVSRFREFLGRYGNHKEVIAARYGLALCLLEGPDGDLPPFVEAAAYMESTAKAQETRRKPEARYNWKTRLVRGLYDRGWTAEAVRELFRLLDWILGLSAELQQRFRADLHEFEKERQMPYLSSIERLAKEEGREEGHKEGRKEGREKGLLEGIALALECRALPSLHSMHGLNSTDWRRMT